MIWSKNQINFWENFGNLGPKNAISRAKNAFFFFHTSLSSSKICCYPVPPWNFGKISTPLSPDPIKCMLSTGIELKSTLTNVKILYFFHNKFSQNDLKMIWKFQISSDQISSFFQNAIWSDLRSLFYQMILIWSHIRILVICQYSVNSSYLCPII